jgi:hypothetical protein
VLTNSVLVEVVLGQRLQLALPAYEELLLAASSD